MDTEDIKEIRRANLRLLAEQYGGQRALAEKADLVPSQLNHIIGLNPVRNLGKKLARKIEQNLGLSHGVLDYPLPTNLSLDMLLTQTSVCLPLIDVSVVADSMNTVEMQKISDGILTRKWLIDNGLTSEKVFEYQFLDSNMQPNLMPNDRLIIDAAQNELSDENVFLLCLNGRLQVKRFFRLLGDEFKLSSDNSDKSLFPDLIIHIAKMNEIGVIGRIIAVQRNLF